MRGGLAALAAAALAATLLAGATDAVRGHGDVVGPQQNVLKHDSGESAR